jgi:hypothetical protein
MAFAAPRTFALRAAAMEMPRMKAIGITSLAFVSLLLGTPAPVLAEHSQHPQSQPKQHRSQRAQQQQRVRHDAWQGHRAQSWESEHRTWEQRGGYHGYQVPDARYRRYFGPHHGFRVSALPFRVVGGQPRFQFRGYWFSVVDPWPEYWQNDWYRSDVVYVGHVDNGYYLFNRSYPNVGIALRVSL